MILKPNEWLFVSTMKCATNSLYDALKKLPGTFWDGGNEFHGRPNRRVAPIHWTTCRNPYDRAVSIWHSTCVREENQQRYDAYPYIIEQGEDPISFDTFVELILLEHPTLRNPWLWRNQSDWHDTFIVDYVFNVERLESELKAEPLGISVKLPRLNVSHGRDFWQEYYKGKTIKNLKWPSMTKKMVQKWAGDDFDRYGYDK